MWTFPDSTSGYKAIPFLNYSKMFILIYLSSFLVFMPYITYGDINIRLDDPSVFSFIESVINNNNNNSNSNSNNNNNNNNSWMGVTGSYSHVLVQSYRLIQGFKIKFDKRTLVALLATCELRGIFGTVGKVEKKAFLNFFFR
jgi:hypothetical protein